MFRFYKSVRNTIVSEDLDGLRTVVAAIAVVDCSKKHANMMASFAAQQMNHELNRKSFCNEGGKDCV